MKRDEAFETLAEVTSTDWNIGRGELNKALAQIREMADLEDELLVPEIRHRAHLYRRLWPEIALSPSALAKHWLRVVEESSQSRAALATNQSAPIRDCSTCDGDGFVVVGVRKDEATQWMKERGLLESAEIEQYALCPDCRG